MKDKTVIVSMSCEAFVGKIQVVVTVHADQTKTPTVFIRNLSEIAKIESKIEMFLDGQKPTFASDSAS